ncbi:MAG: hypothetical protein GY820_48250, partial [Gammaproteobacteria bacterium]|nr:hypothetical protein [Gammaproteobacteria bacterium]
KVDTSTEREASPRSQLADPEKAKLEQYEKGKERVAKEREGRSKEKAERFPVGTPIRTASAPHHSRHKTEREKEEQYAKERGPPPLDQKGKKTKTKIRSQTVMSPPRRSASQEQPPRDPSTDRRMQEYYRGVYRRPTGSRGYWRAPFRRPHSPPRQEVNQQQRGGYRGRFPRFSRGGGYRGRRGGPRRGFDFEFRRGGGGQSFSGGWREEYGSYKDYMQQPEEQEGEGQGVPEPTEARPDDDEEEEQAGQSAISIQETNVANTKALTKKLHSAEEDEEDDEWADDPTELLTVPTT